MKKCLIIIVLAAMTGGSAYAQSKWYSTGEIEFIFPRAKEYSYDDNNTNIGYKVDLPTKEGFLLDSYGLLYTYNYLLFRKLSLGVLGGAQVHNNPDIFMLKLGGIMKFFFVDEDNVYVKLILAHEFSTSKNDFNKGTTVRFGLGFPVLKKESFNLNVNIFTVYDYFDLTGANPLDAALAGHIPKTLIIRGFALSVGAKF